MSDFEHLASDAVIEVAFDPDMGLFPPATERALRFLCSYEIGEAIRTTDGPIEVVTVGAGFPWVAAMQENEHRKRCDSEAKQIASSTNQQVLSVNLDRRGIEEREARALRGTLQHPIVSRHVRTAVGSLLVNPSEQLSNPALKPAPRKKLIGRGLREHFSETDRVVVQKNEPEDPSYRGRGGWEIVTTEPADPLLVELVARLGTVEQAERAIAVLARTTAGLCPDKLRPFSLKVLDTRTTEELLGQAEIMYAQHEEVTDTQIYRRAVELAEGHIVQETEHDLSAIEDGSATVIIVSHWPLRHQTTGQADDAGWALLLDQLHRKLQTNGIAVFFPWSLPESFDPEHIDMTLGGVQSMMINEYHFDVQITGEPIRDLLEAIAVFGQEPAMLASQMRGSGSKNIGRLIARKRRTLRTALERK